MAEPLDGIRVVELSTGILGPMCGVYLSDMGADVVKIEPPEGDMARYVRGVGNQLPPEVPSPFFTAVNRGKRSVVIAGHSAPGREALHRLASEADVFLSNFRPEALASLGLDYETVRHLNPRLVYATATGFGAIGPEAGRGMVDGSGQARGGISSVTGQPGGPPLMAGAVIADSAGGMLLALGVVTALLARERHGVGQKVDTSALGGQLWLQSWELAHASMTGYRSGGQGSHHPIFSGVYGNYVTSDRRGLFLAAVPSPRDWEAFCDFGGIADVAADPRWDTFQKRAGFDPTVPVEIVNQLRPFIAQAVASRGLAEWEGFLSGRPEIIAHRVQDYSEVLNDPQAILNGYFAALHLPATGVHRVVGNVVGLSATPGSVKAGPPGKGEHTDEVLRSLGYAPEEIGLIRSEADEELVRRMKTLDLKPPD